MKYLKRFTTCLTTILILGNSATTMGNNTNAEFIPIEDLPKISMPTAEPIPIEEILYNQESARLAEENKAKLEEELAEWNRQVEILQRIVEAEATGEGLRGKEWVAQVIMNRCKDGRTIEDVVFARNQFSPITDGRYYSVTITDETIQAVDNVLDGKNERHDAIYFFDLRSIKNQKTLAWINGLKFVGRVGNHWFYKD